MRFTVKDGFVVPRGLGNIKTTTGRNFAGGMFVAKGAVIVKCTDDMAKRLGITQGDAKSSTKKKDGE